MTASISVEPAVVRWPMRKPFKVSGYTWHEMAVLQVAITRDGHLGRGEGAPLFYRAETAEDLCTAVRSLGSKLPADALEPGWVESLDLPGGARNALDCALWDLNAKLSGMRVHQLLDCPEPQPLNTVVTVSIDEPDIMARHAKALLGWPVLKLKLGRTAKDADRIAAVREANPDSELIVDANCGWSRDELESLSDTLIDARVAMLEQPLHPDDDHALAGLHFPFPLCADESCQAKADLPRLAGSYQMINIKLDKCGGLGPAISLAEAAAQRGFELMIGNMLGSSLAMAPAHLVGQRCRYVDLDGPLNLAEDEAPPMRFDGARIYPASPTLWG
ncbi:MAG: dipeptide epimerase [Pseudomonadota bacterium]